MTEEDLTGRSRLIKNTMVSWASQFVLIISGFVMPRLMHESLGQTVLGIWDFGWTFVAYVNLMGLGIGTNINRFVARYRLDDDLDSLSAMVSSVIVMQVFISMLVLAITVGLYFSMEFFFGDSLAGEIETARSIILILGICVTIQMLTNPAIGIMTGYHRWDIHNGFNAATAILSFVLMVSVLLIDGSLVEVGIAYLVSVITIEIARVRLTYLITPDLTINLSHCSFEQGKLAFIFGTKTLMVYAPMMLVVQTASLLTVSLIGPAGLAVLARPRSLVQHLHTLVLKFTHILTPIVASLEVTDDSNDVKEFIVKLSRINFLMTLPPIVFIAIFGQVIIDIWMGEEYRNELLIVILSVGYLLPIGQGEGMISNMQGLDRHGKLTIPLAVFAFLFFVLTFTYLIRSDWTLISSALLVTVPLTLTYGIMLPWYSCHLIGISKAGYLIDVIALPIVYNLPFIFGLGLSRYLLNNEYLFLSLVMFLVTVLAEAIIYYFVVLPDSFKQLLLDKFMVLKQLAFGYSGSN